MQRQVRIFGERFLRNGLYLAGAGSFVVWLAVFAPARFFHPLPTLTTHHSGDGAEKTATLLAANKPAVIAHETSTDSGHAISEPKIVERIAPETFVAAVRMGDVQQVETLLNKGADVNAADASGHTALLVAAEKGNLLLVHRLLAADADVNLPDSEGRTPLIAASAAGETAIMRELLDHGADVNAADAENHGAIHHAINARNLEAIQFLLAQRADCTRTCCEGKNAIAHAFETFDRQIEQAVLAAQPASLVWKPFTRDALYSAIRGRDREMTKLLLAKHPAPPTLEDARQSLLAYSIAWQDLDQLKFLLDCGADANAPLAIPAEKRFVQLFRGEMIPHYLTEEPGMTPLMLAAAMGRTDIVQALIEHGAKRGALTAKWKLNAENFAAWADSAPTLLVLLGKSPDLENQPLFVRISLREQQAYFYKNGQIAMTSRVSTGKPGHDTPTGNFVITDKHPSHKSTIYKVDMPFFMRLNCREFGMHEGILPGYPASHGCIRMPGDKARELYKQVDIGTLVTIAN